MAISLASPGISIKEVDLTRGGINNTSRLSAGIAGPFEKGPVNQVVNITSENDLVNIFGRPSTKNYQYEYWYSASNFLSYGGSLQVVRCAGTNLKNSNAGVGVAATTLTINNFEEYQTASSTGYYWAAKNPGSWAQNIKVCIIDDFADQTLSGINTTGVTVGFGVTQSFSGVFAGIGQTAVVAGLLKGIVTGVGSSYIDVKITSENSSGSYISAQYTENGLYAFKASSIVITTNTGVTTSTQTPTIASDWYNNQSILSTANEDSVNLSWRSIAEKPKTNKYVSDRNGKNDAFHVVVIDSKKSNNVSGNSQEILEIFTNLSKASDTTISQTEKIYYKDYLAYNSKYIYSGASIGDSPDANWKTVPVVVNFTDANFTVSSTDNGKWGIQSENRTFNSIGNIKYDLTGGTNYNGTVDGYEVQLSNLITSYEKFANETEVSINYLLQGSASLGKESEQAKAKKLISIAESRKDCMTFISPNRDSVVNVTSTTTQRDNVLSFFSPLTSSSYAAFDSGYQYIYDRFNDQFVYMPCSSDTAGLCVRTDINQHPWYSPAGKTRGSYNNTIKLAYNPSLDDRDRLYSQRINSIISSPGAGIILFGDKTALSYQSAFDRINVRRLFITIEQAIKSAADDQLFEFNDASTRANFVNIVDPYLRDVQIKRGVSDYLLVCDETNNTPDVIDRNEFIANIFIKPARSINFIGLTFVAARTGVSFETIVGTI
jgi:hypothetical protein